MAERSGAWPAVDNCLISGTSAWCSGQSPTTGRTSSASLVRHPCDGLIIVDWPTIVHRFHRLASHRPPVPLLLHSGRSRTICPWNSPLQFALAATAADRPPILLKPLPADDISCLICILRADERNQPAVYDVVFTRLYTAVRLCL